MVLLTYQDDSIIRQAEVAEKDTVAKTETPKTAYIDKLYAFNEEYANEERCDLFFLCQDGEIPAHRLVISNASKYIMAMQDDQSPFYPVYISVPDLTKEIVNTLVRLAYTGQMNIPPGYTSDELLDAMQALGWVNTDCLTATYLDTSSTSTDEDFSFPVSSRTAESLETVLKMNFPVSSKVEAEASDDDDDDGGMEMALPDVPMSDDDEGKLEIVVDKKKEPAVKKVGRKAKAKPVKASPVKNKAPSNATAKRRQSPKPTIEPSKADNSPSARKGSRKNNEEKNTTPAKDTTADATSGISTENDSEPLRSRTRTIRKPKKFDDLIVLTPTKRKESPTKTPSKAAPKNSKPNETEDEAKEVKSLSKKGSANNKSAVGAKPAGNSSRRSTSSDNKDTPRIYKITSYFNKRSPRKSNDTAPADADEAKTSETTEANNVQNATRAGDIVSNSVEGTGEDNHVDGGNDSSNNSTSSMRKRGRSASSKGDAEIPQEEENGDSEISPKSRKKRNLLENSELEAEETGNNNPAKRGRKASTMSNASKSSSKGK